MVYASESDIWSSKMASPAKTVPAPIRWGHTHALFVSLRVVVLVSNLKALRSLLAKKPIYLTIC